MDYLPMLEIYIDMHPTGISVTVKAPVAGKNEVISFTPKDNLDEVAKSLEHIAQKLRENNTADLFE